SFVFFFQAEDGIRDFHVTGVQTCALPIYTVIEAEDGTEAVELFRESQPDLVLLDALMPRMDGMEAARQIKALAGERLVPLIFLKIGRASGRERVYSPGGGGSEERKKRGR